MKQLRQASELRKEHDEGIDKAFLDTWSKVVDTINQAHAGGGRVCNIENVVKRYDLKQRVNSNLESLGYKVSEYSDNRDSYYNVSW